MHWSSYEKMLAFRDCYLNDFRETPLSILDVGSQAPSQEAFTYARVFDSTYWEYTGLDIEAGHNVDVVADSPFSWDGLGSDHYDLVVSGQALEHVTYFWATTFEMVRVAKPGGLMVVVVPRRVTSTAIPWIAGGSTLMDWLRWRSTLSASLKTSSPTGNAVPGRTA